MEWTRGGVPFNAAARDMEFATTKRITRSVEDALRRNDEKAGESTPAE